MTLRLWSILISVALASGLAQGQSPSLEDLEKRIEQGKKAKEQREAASRRTESEQKSQSTRMATIVVRSDAPCTLLIDGKRMASIPAGEPRSVNVQPGDQFVDCVSTEKPTVKFSGVQKATAGQKSALEISLQSQVADVRAREGDEARAEVERKAAAVRAESEKRAAAERAELERRAAAERAESERKGDAERAEAQRIAAEEAKRQAALRFVEAGDRVRDTSSGLEWSASDNGSDINWNKAQSYCSGKGGNWRLPTSAELLTLYDSSGALTTRCGPATCKVSPAFRLSSVWIWTGDLDVFSQAWDVNLYYGLRHSSTVGTSGDTRALCIRRP